MYVGMSRELRVILIIMHTCMYNSEFCLKIEYCAGNCIKLFYVRMYAVYIYIYIYICPETVAVVIIMCHN